MGWFCTTSFGDDAFQMGNMESFFTLLLSPLHLALSLTAWWSLSLSHSVSLFFLCHCTQAVSQTHTHKHRAIFVINSLRETHARAHTNTLIQWRVVHTNVCTQTPPHTHQDADITTHRHSNQGTCDVPVIHFKTFVHWNIHGNSVGTAHSNIHAHAASLKYSSKCWCWTLTTHW